jgi:hypothetical protein
VLLWRHDRIGEGLQVLEDAFRLRRPGEYQVQAAITALHIQGTDAGAADWAQIAELYGVLAILSPSPVIELNRAAAVGFAAGPEAGLALLTGTAGTRGAGRKLAGAGRRPKQLTVESCCFLRPAAPESGCGCRPVSASYASRCECLPDALQDL